MNEMRKLTGGDLLAKALRDAGVDRAFVLHGGHLEALFRGCTENDIELVDFRHEASAGHAADAYARTTGGLGVCIVTSGPGFTNAVTAMANAQLDGSPVLFIVGAPPIRERETNELQGGFDQLAVARPVVKWAVSVGATERVADIAAAAIRRAMTGRRGAVMLEVPIDVLHLPAPSRSTRPHGVNLRPRAAPPPGDVDTLLAMLRQAKRPVVIAGMEAGFSTDAALLRGFAESTRTPVVFKPAAEGLLPFDHPLHAGSSGVLGLLASLERPRPDLVVLLGARLGMWLGGRSGAIVPHEARLVQVTADAGEAGRLRDVDLAIGADIGETLRAALAAVDREIEWPDRTVWVADLVAARTALTTPPPRDEALVGLHPLAALTEVVAAAGRDAAYAIDGGEAAAWARQAIRVSGPRRVAAPGYLGCLGTGPGFAIGLQFAHPGRRIVLITGDGAFGFNMAELDTMVEKRLPIVVVVMNNGAWGMSLHGQQIMYGPNYSAVSLLGQTDYAAIGKAFGCWARRVTRLEDVAPSIVEAFASGKPAVVELMLADVIHPNTTAALGKTVDPGEITIPYYENVPLDPYA